MKNKKLFVYRDDLIYLHHTSTINPDSEDFSFKSHSHNMVEIYYFLRGNARFTIEGNIYKLEQGNIMVMDCGQTHNLLLDNCSVYERIAILIDSSALPREFDLISQYVHNGVNSFTLSKQEQIWFQESFYTITKTPENLKHKIVYSFLSMLFICLSTKVNYYKAPNNIEENTVKKAIDYINKNLSKELNLDKIAKNTYCCKAILNRKFKEIMGCTVWEYVIRRRIFSARQRLYFSHSINNAFENSGFNDYSSFFRSYKKYIGLSPSEDLKKIKN